MAPKKWVELDITKAKCKTNKSAYEEGREKNEYIHKCFE